MTTEENKESPLHFPCDFVIKVFGLASDQFELEAITLIRKHITELREDAIRSRPSKDGKYLALSITITAESKDQLDAIYRELSASPHVLMAL